MKPLSLYIHSPFCTNKCGYCDFNSWAETSRKPQEQWLKAIQKQLNFWLPHVRKAGYGIRTIFHGGGTPSLIALDLYQELVSNIRQYDLSQIVEWSIEANPETLTQESLEKYAEFGITRLSMGIQSFDDEDLERLERQARRQDNLRSLDLLKKHWKQPWSADLMFGLPGQTQEKWRHQLETLLPYEPTHLSCYQLTLGTERSKLWQQPEEEDLLEQFEWTRQYLEKLGWHRYEISNFAKPGFECQHNLVYWRTGYFLGLGPGASGVLPPDLLGGGHQKQPDRFESWANGAGEELFEKKIITSRNHEDALKEKLMMSLRLSEGILLSDFPTLKEIFNRWVNNDRAKIHQDRLVLTLEGTAILNTLLVEAFEFLP